ncbi:ribonuclease H2 non-catalytic subunit-domain-containing protein [Achaetomium macrosporum]|uniref:Ribonuclease H2 non-catalytic subunit-domain-containing protein n=1 Tax=Achaetomium macrosporum TaxID=79813 RepID=A0AAN7CE68_9PEZI|nr:ribonuclease H2 non-catalytic subunit-domain-containing protein [Achaetomium macrosporum]
MLQPMLNLKPETPSGATPKATPHLLPCRVHHNGSVEPNQSFWDPKVGEDGISTAYFRGRKLQGKTVELPDGCRGVVAAVSAAEEPSRRPEEADVIDLEADTPQATLQVQAEFDEMVVWGHEAAVDASADPYMRGVEEWMALAEKIHSYAAPTSKEK